MPATPWDEIRGHRCDQCGGYATHFYGSLTLCCQCHGGDLVSQEDARREHEGLPRPAREEPPHAD